MKYLKTFENFGSYPDIEFAEQIVDDILPELKKRKDSGEKITVDSFEKEMREKFPTAFKNKGDMFDAMLHIIVNKGDDIGFEFDIDKEEDYDLNESIEISTLDLISAWLVYNNIKKYGFTQTLKNMGNNLTDWMANFTEFVTTMYGEPVSSEITEYKFKELLNRFKSKF